VFPKLEEGGNGRIDGEEAKAGGETSGFVADVVGMFMLVFGRVVCGVGIHAKMDTRFHYFRYQIWCWMRKFID